MQFSPGPPHLSGAMTTPAVDVPGRMAWFDPGFWPTESYSWSMVHHGLCMASA
jgi:hypothetical protein